MSLYNIENKKQQTNKRKAIINLGNIKSQNNNNNSNGNKLIKPNPGLRNQDSELMNSELSELLNTNVVELVKQSKQFQFGNYNSYYSTRFERKWQDPRIKVFQKENILNKDVLDIGCNDGSLTLQLAIKYFPQKIVGIDIDYHMINQAIENLNFLKENQKSKEKVISLKQQKQLQQQKQQNQEQQSIKQEYNSEQLSESIKEEEQEQIKTEKLLEKLSKLPKCFIKKDSLLKALDKKILQEKQDQIKPKQEIPDSKNNLMKQLESVKQPQNIQNIIIQNKFPHNIIFRMENYIEDITLTERYDTILCFSMTKWVHLNFGDTGIKRLFHKLYKSLKINGLLFLEPQDWKSYKKKKNMCDIFQKNFHDIQLKPEKFKDYLENELGFQLIRCFKNGKNIDIQQKQQENQNQQQEQQQQQQQLKELLPQLKPQNIQNQQQLQQNLNQEQEMLKEQEMQNTPTGFKRPVYIYKKIK